MDLVDLTALRTHCLVDRHWLAWASHQSPVTSHQSPVTSHQSPVTSHQAPGPTNRQPVWLRTRCDRGPVALRLHRFRFKVSVHHPVTLRNRSQVRAEWRCGSTSVRPGGHLKIAQRFNAFQRRSTLGSRTSRVAKSGGGGRIARHYKNAEWRNESREKRAGRNGMG